MDDTIPTILRQYPYPLLFATGTGSRAFGCASDTSDYDIHGGHLLPLQHMLGLSSETQDTIEQKVDETPNHPKLEIATHDLKKFIKLLIKGNGNVLEDLYSPLVFVTSPEHVHLKELGLGCISKRCAAHYKGMAYNQQRNLKNHEVKKLIHMYRCLLMGIHLMKHGTLIMHLPTLADLYEYESIHQLILRKLSPSRFSLGEETVNTHLSTIDFLMKALEQAADESTLPDYTGDTTRHALEHFLIDTRLKERRYL